MKAPAVPAAERDRLEALRALELLDTTPEERFDRITRLAKHLLGTPIALVSLVDADRQWFKSRDGLDAPETPRDISFCGHAILQDDLFVVSDAAKHPDFSDNPLVTGPPHIRFYAGCPLRTVDGLRLGTLCVIDRKARVMTATERRLLRDLARIVEVEINRADVNHAVNRVLDKERELSTLLDHTGEIVLSLEPNGTVSYANRAWSRVFGAAAESLRDCLHEDCRELLGRHLQEALTKGESRVDRLRLRAEDDRVVHLSGRFIHKTDDPPPRVVRAYLSDVSGEVAAIRRLMRFFNVSLDLLCVAGFDGFIKQSNPAFQETLGHDLETIHSRPFVEFVHPDDRDAAMEMANRVARGGKAVQFENRFLCKDGSIRWLSWSAVADPEDKLIFAVARDVTERRELLRNLRAARDQADESARIKAEFLANMSHEIRTPMNGVIGMTTLLSATPLAPEQQEYVGAIERSGETLLAIINNILDFSKLESGKLLLETTQVNLRDVVEDVAELLGPAARAKSLELTSGLGEDVPERVLGDPVRLRQVLTNLAANAVKFTEKGEVSIRIDLGSRIGSSAVLKFSVNDTGIGFDPAEKDVLFESFTQADSSTTRRFGGTGLGLAISKQLVELMGGELDAQSLPGVGTRFFFELQLELAPAGEQVAERWESLNGLQVLVVDDNATNRDVFAGILRNHGMNPVLVDGSAAALEMLESDSDGFDVALVDMQLPEMDGLNLGKRIRHMHGIRRPKLILVTSTGPEHREEALSRGFSGYLIKPVRQRSLLRTIAHAVQGGMTEIDVLPQPLAFAATEDQPRGRILVAEDNRVNQLVTLRMLQKLGFECDVAKDGHEALAFLQSRNYDAVLMDCQMPGLDGYETTRRLRAGGGDKADIPVVALTAHALEGDREKAMEAGMTDYITKPIKLPDLKRTLNKWLK